MSTSASLIATTICLFCILVVAQGFSTLIPLQKPSALKLKQYQRHTLAAGKGFGNAPEPLSPKKKESESEASTSTTSSGPMAASPQTEIPTKTQTESMNSGQKALADMRRERAEAKDAELRKMRDMLQADKQVEEAPAAIPEKVAQRMGTRMLGFVGVPLFLGLGSFVAFWYFATYKDLEFQPGLVAATTIGILAIGLVGITYSVMSTSWDEDREGNALGVDEFQKNVANIKQGLERSKENAILRDTLNQVGSDNIDRAVADLEKREGKESKTKRSLESKLKDELE